MYYLAIPVAWLAERAPKQNKGPGPLLPTVPFWEGFKDQAVLIQRTHYISLKTSGWRTALG